MLGTGAGGRTQGGAVPSGAGGEVQSSMISWRVEELGELNNGGLGKRSEDEPSGAGFAGDIVSYIPLFYSRAPAELLILQADLEAMLLPEAEQAVELSRTLDQQSASLTKLRSRLSRLRRAPVAADASSDNGTAETASKVKEVSPAARNKRAARC